MILENEMLVRLFGIYKNQLNLPLDSDIRPPFNQVCQAIENGLVGHFAWNALSTAAVNPELLALIKECLVLNSERVPVYDKLAAKKAILQKQQALSAKKFDLDLPLDDETAGIQERYLQSQLSAEEPLRYLDIKRFITCTGMQNSIKILNFNTEDIGLILHDERIKPENVRAPYTVKLMLNDGQQGMPAYTNWVGVSITVNPSEHKLFYKIWCGEPLSKEQQSKLEARIKAAVKFESVSEDSGARFSAFPRVEQISGQVICSNDGSLGTYKVLHGLYDGVDSPLARDFSAKPCNLKLLQQEIYRAQLSAIQISQEEATKPSLAPRFQEGRINLKKSVEICHNLRTY